MTLESSSLVYSTSNSCPVVPSLITPHALIMSTKTQQSNGTAHCAILNTQTPVSGQTEDLKQETSGEKTGQTEDLKQETSGEETGEADTTETESKYSSEEEEDETTPPEDYVEMVEVKINLTCHYNGM